jgi:hypothetical protein
MATITLTRAIERAGDIDRLRTKVAPGPSQEAAMKDADRMEHTLCVEVLEAIAEGFLDKSDCREIARAALGRS